MALRLIGLTRRFAPTVVFFGHGSATENNAYASALHCGACGGNPGGNNARVLAKILNEKDVREYLKEKGITIPDTTVFYGGEHNTTTDEAVVYDLPKEQSSLQEALNRVQSKRDSGGKERSQDWAQVRPEWGLARNGAFIVAPRKMTENVDLKGRVFLHSYDAEADLEGTLLETIMTAPLVVAQGINAQYFFSTYDNVAYGGGSKVTKNITGKIGVMQGNGSDLMHGLPLQSVYENDTHPYHEMLRLSAIIFAPKKRVEGVIAKHSLLANFFRNGWVHLYCIDPNDEQSFVLERDLTWSLAESR